MKNKVLVAMGIGIAAALAPVALNSVEAKADEVNPDGGKPLSLIRK